MCIYGYSSQKEKDFLLYLFFCIHLVHVAFYLSVVFVVLLLCIYTKK